MTNKKLNNKSNYKKYLTCNEHVSLLRERGLKIEHENIFISFLKKYNYQVCVNGYNDLLFENEQRSRNRYKSYVTDY